MSRPLWFVGADGSVVSRALGVLRLSLLALAIGQGLVANAFATASLLPYLISLVVTGGILGSTLLPQLLPPRHQTVVPMTRRLPSASSNGWGPAWTSTEGWRSSSSGCCC